MKRVALFGGSGRTGKYVVKDLLDHEFKVKVLVRDRSKLDIKSENLEIIEGNVLSKQDVDNTIKDSDIVVSVLGHVKNSPSNLLKESTENILASMKDYNVQRIIVLTGGGVRIEGDKPKVVDKIFGFLLKTLSKRIYQDSLNFVNLVRSSDTEWTVVRAPMLNSNPGLGSYHHGMVGDKNLDFKISREDLSKFILDVLKADNQFKRKAPFVANKK